MLKLPYGLSFADLYRRDGLLKLDAAFVRALEADDAALCKRMRDARADAGSLTVLQESELLLALAPHVEGFIARLFGIESEVHRLKARHQDLAPLYSCKRLFVQRKAMHKFKADDAARLDGAELRAKLTALMGGEFGELAFARSVMGWLQH